MNRKQLAAAIDDIDRQIEALQTDKRELFGSYREANGKAECKAAQAAIKLRQKYAAGKGDELEEHDALVAEIFVEISDRAPRATRSNDRASREERSKSRLSEAMADHKEFSAELAAQGMISPESHAENIAISDAAAKKLGAGVESRPLTINGFRADTMPADHLMSVRAPDGSSKRVPYAEFWQGLVDRQQGAAA